MIGVEPLVEIGFLGSGQGDGLGHLGDAVLDVAHRLDSLGDTEAQDAPAYQFAHALIIPNLASSYKPARANTPVECLMGVPEQFPPFFLDDGGGEYVYFCMKGYV